MQTRINLLPGEYRKKEMTPLAVLLPLLVTVTLVMASGAFWAWLHFGELAQVESHRSELEGIYASKQRSLKYAAALRGEINDYKKRSDTIQTIATSRVLWTKKMDELCDVVADDDGGERYLVWLETFQVKAPSSRGSGRKKRLKGEEVIIKGLCFSDEAPLQRFNNFHEAIKQSPYFNDFMSISNPKGKLVPADGDGKLTPSRAWTIDLTMTMAPRMAGKKLPGRGHVREAESIRKR